MRTLTEPQNSNSPPPPQPLQVVHGGAGEQRFDPRQMQIVPAFQNTPFQLPHGWVVELRPRGPNSSVQMSDKYYYEPGTGRKFRSLVSVKRYLSGEEERVSPRKKQSTSLVPYQNSGFFRRVVYGGKVFRPDELEETLHTKLDDIVPETLQPKSCSMLPDGWIVEEIPRKCGSRSDRYYIEPKTGRKFRSIPEVQRYLASKKCRSKRRESALRNHSTAPRSAAPRKKRTLKIFKDTIFDLANPPEKINWVFSGDGRDKWSPLVEECVLPDYVKEQWAETFLLGMNGWKHRLPQLMMTGSNQATNA